jgi:hypothetical protein
MKFENKAWIIASIYTVFIIAIAIMLNSCASSHGCHSKGVYVSKSIKKAQSKPNAH